MLAHQSGLACRSGAGWTVPVLAEGGLQTSPSYRQAGHAMPDAVLQAIDERIAGKPLDIAGEQAARKFGWTVSHEV